MITQSALILWEGGHWQSIKVPTKTLKPDDFPDIIFVTRIKGTCGASRLEANTEPGCWPEHDETTFVIAGASSGTPVYMQAD